MHRVHFIYEELYAHDDSKAMMKTTAPFFFDYLNDILADYLLLEFSKLTDPAITLGEPNLTTNYIVEKMYWEEVDKEKLLQYNKELMKFTRYFKGARNKLLAHIDLKVAINDNIKALGGFPLGEEKKFLHILWEFCNYASIKKSNNFLGDINLHYGNGTPDLLVSLQKSIAFDKLFEEGTLEEKMKFLEYKK